MRLAIFTILLVIASYIGYRIAQRMSSEKDPDGKPGCIMIGYVTLVYLCMCALSFTFLSLTLSGLYGNVVNQRYEATVINVRAYESGTRNIHTHHIQLFTNSNPSFTHYR